MKSIIPLRLCTPGLLINWRPHYGMQIKPHEVILPLLTHSVAMAMIQEVQLHPVEKQTPDLTYGLVVKDYSVTFDSTLVKTHSVLGYFGYL